MQTIEYKTIDKSEWANGEWQNEPDKKQWLDEATGLPCLIVRGPSGALCGYVGVNEGHPYFDVGYNQCAENCGREWCDHTPSALLEAHGGITFAGFCQKTSDESVGICHKVTDGENDRVHWFGFDCAHSGDICPKYDRDGFGYGTYRDFDYVQSQVDDLARQLKEFA